MKTRILLKLVGLACAAFVVFTVFSFSGASAQTRNTSTARPSPSATPKLITPSPTPSVAPTPPADDPNEVIKVETELVNVNVRVVDRSNRPVNNLQQREFKVYEDGVPQEIRFFTKAEVPTNYALVIDNSGSLRSQLEKVIEASKIIVQTNHAEDETSVIRFVSSDKIEISQDFTNNKSDINDALDNLFIEGGQTAIIDAVYLAAEKVDEYENSRNPNEKKRRALILVSDGEDRDSYYKEAQLFERLRESEVQIYVVGFSNELSKEGGFIGKSPQDKAKSFLKRLADETGGKAYFPNSTAELNDIARDISSELRTQYLLSYEPTGDASAAKFKSIKVTVDDGPNKEKRIAITRTGRSAPAVKGSTAPKLQKTNP
jgi:Ca-activated chloride channel homolog